MEGKKRSRWGGCAVGDRIYCCMRRNTGGRQKGERGVHEWLREIMWKGQG